MATNKKQVLIRVQPDTYEKLKFISDKNHRSVSNQLEWLMLQFISDYESTNGQISLINSSAQKNVGVLQQNNGGTNFIAMGGGNSYNTAAK